MSSAQTIRKLGQRYPLGMLLLAIFLMIVGAPLTMEFTRIFPSLTGPAALAPLTAMLTVASALSVRESAKHPIRLIVFAGVILLLLALSSLLTHRAFAAAHLVTQSVFLVVVTMTILRVVFTAPIVNGNVLCGAACVYLLAGVLCGYLFSIVELVVPHSFEITDPALAKQVGSVANQPGWLIYFSFTTLTTVGFGDILPVRPLARSLSVLEAVIGQIMVVVMIARLVGLHVAYSTSEHGRSIEFKVDD